GRLWWRFAAPELWERTADAGGSLQQSSGLTCSPAAAVMLLHRHGIPTSEGEMAYLAGTSLFGTDAPSMCRALQAQGGPFCFRAEARRTDYEECRRDGSPFIAHVQRDLLGHAILVERMDAEWVGVVDPLDGQRRTISRGEFEAAWSGTALRILR